MEYSAEDIASDFIKGNGLISAVLFAMCEESGMDYGKVLARGVDIYIHQKEKSDREIVERVEEEIKKDVEERDVVVEDVVYSDDELLDMWVRDYEGFVSKGEMGKAEMLLGLIGGSERVELRKRFNRIMGMSLGLVG